MKLRMSTFVDEATSIRILNTGLVEMMQAIPGAHMKLRRFSFVLNNHIGTLVYDH